MIGHERPRFMGGKKLKDEELTLVYRRRIECSVSGKCGLFYRILIIFPVVLVDTMVIL